MLTARTKNGNQVCLGNDYQKETLLNLRKREEFFCPVCGERVLLKLGEQRIFHFAHKQGGNCREFFENESIYHMEGKRQLYQWLIRQNIPAILEYYDRDIQQRPDIMFNYKRKRYALEYQCSTIAEDIFLKRTQNYLRNDYIPIWIIGGKQLHQKKLNIAQFSIFHYLFLRETADDSFYIPAYCPEKELFQIIGSIFPYSIKNTFVQNSIYTRDLVTIDLLLNPKIPNQLNFKDWNDEVERVKFLWSLHPNAKNGFLHEIYNRSLNLCLLPSEIGLPIRHALYIQTSPIIWQTYLYLDLFAQKEPGDFFSIKDAEYSFLKRIKRNEIMVRNLPQIQGMNPFDAALDYFNILEKLGVLAKKGKLFQILKKMAIPLSNREKEEMSQHFFLKYLEQNRKR